MTVEGFIVPAMLLGTDSPSSHSVRNASMSPPMLLSVTLRAAALSRSTEPVIWSAMPVQVPARSHSFVSSDSGQS